MNCQNTPPSQRGFTALELIIVLIIGFSIIGLSASKMADMMDSSKTTRALDSIVNLFIGIKSLEIPDGYGTGNLLPRLVEAGVIPKSLKIQGSGATATLTNQWNQAVEIDGNQNNQQKFIVTYRGVPNLACTKLVKDLFSNYSITVEDATGTPIVIAKNANLQQIINACKQAPTTLILTDW